MRYLVKLLLVPKNVHYNNSRAYDICANCDKAVCMTDTTATTPNITLWEAVNDNMNRIVCNTCMTDFFQLNPVRYTNE